MRIRAALIAIPHAEQGSVALFVANFENKVVSRASTTTRASTTYEKL